MPESIRTVPESVLALLRHRWMLPEPGFSHFTAVFNDDPLYRDRKTDPSYYHIRAGVESDLTFSHAEALAMIRDDVFGALAKDYGRGVSINEHAEHALQDFCEAVYGAWSGYLDRLRQIEHPGAFPQ